MPLRVVFLGSPEFAVPSLVTLAQHNNIEAPLVVTQPDRPAGRGRRLVAPPVKTAALELGLPVFQPETLRDDAAVRRLADANPDLLVVVAYGELLRRNVLDLAPYGCLNVHPSLLPKYRGATPIPAAILAGDDETGVTIMKLVRKLDAGPIVRQETVDMKPDDTTAALSERLARIAAAMLPETCLAYVAGAIEPVPQDDAAATYTREWTAEDARVDWSWDATRVERLVRAAYPWPVAWTTHNHERLRILASDVAGDDPDVAHVEPGTVAQHGGRILVVTGNGLLELREVQPAGKRVMSATDWFRGLRADRIILGA